MSSQSERPGEPGADTEPPNRRWIKVVVIVIAIIALVVVAMMLLSGGEHGPWQHAHGPSGSEAPVVAARVPSEGVHP